MLKIKKSNPAIGGKESFNYAVVIPLCIFAIICLLAAGLFIFRYSSLVEATTSISSFAKADTLMPPMRPGIQGIVISGPILRDLVFDINLDSGSPQPINWDELVGIDQVADVKVRAVILATGKLVIRDAQRDIQAFGFPEAGNYIERMISTWTYFPYKSGTIKFHFNVGSRAQKLIIDGSGLNRSADIPEKIRVRDGLMYYIKGLKSKEVSYERLSF